MKTILCYGDSLTWGYDAAGPGRHAYADRWPSVVEAELGSQVRIIAEGLNGRTTVYDDPLAAADRNGGRVLPTLLATHEPVDILVIALGSNDLKRHTGGGRAFEASEGIARLIEIVRSFASSFAYDSPQILLVSPPALVPTADAAFDAMFGFALEESQRFDAAYAALAAEKGCDHVAASRICTATPLDGIHLDAENTAKLGRAIAEALRPMLLPIS
ncbi:SGNH/GDSL hydrolase family protein [Aureimonas pseudogalii]|uniref:Lysophospholipase L1-like esterase n=1 Tax=Aureimonas pseudogalii TaxID=1744844 RepID=A0A7W6H504_9HYPH|nr:SGNH/GDSL hydrolase family protein [Aureimonas pseudogalii]MBB3998666.1 lysophospholipase L1-like esterase [Aureimonas pseudogalii]